MILTFLCQPFLRIFLAIDVSDVLLGEIEDEKELNIPIYK